ncbi:amidase [Parapusillimonas granuli]|uniref:Amidase n=1 Tax=Parapusillimonas granuli TaxID=380911 RepID=A0A853G0I2_9BURK|nr:amidase [Parapusillimonas granuli]MBB5215944.1 aspartyl-tRNA(Asn)/glutamyl-tRNA(Gln) amidotransferase subunit A [Parapusillimonas granuli]NYT50758.1 amidase [Parapusillimonas granuli]
MNEEIWQSSATKIAAAVSRRELSCQEVMRTFLDRIAALDGHTNAFSVVEPGQALIAARDADEAIRAGRALGPLHGLPITIKDVIPTQGMRTTYGSRLYADHIPETEPEVVARVRRAGAIIVGKTTTPEFAHKVLTDSPLHGITRNPWSLERSPGGSSGGAAVAAAMGYCPLNVSTDGAGSSRIPAANCHVVGLKPTMGAIPNDGGADLFAMQVLGVIARTTEDASLLFDVLSGPYDGDPFSLGAENKPDTEAGSRPVLKNLRVRYFPRMGNVHVDAEVLQAVERALALMETQGSIVLEDGDINWRHDAWRIMLRAQQAARFRDSYPGIKHLLDPSMAQCIEEGLSQDVIELQDALLARSALYKDLHRIFQTADVIISPTSATPALFATHHANEPVIINGKEAGTLRQAWYNYTVPINGAGHPAISLPCGFSHEGLPIGMQIIGPWHRERMLLRLAAELQELLGWTDRWPDLASQRG